MLEQDTGFFIASFPIDGKLEGIEHQPIEKLSSKWLDICDRHLESHGERFSTSWGGNLSHIHMRFTSASGVALLTILAGGVPAASVVLASGHSSDSEKEVITMFVNSLRQTDLVRVAASADSFKETLTIKERPLLIVVPWPNGISDQDHALVRELTIHTAGVFFLRQQKSGA